MAQKRGIEGQLFGGDGSKWEDARVQCQEDRWGIPIQSIYQQSHQNRGIMEAFSHSQSPPTPQNDPFQSSVSNYRNKTTSSLAEQILDLLNQNIDTKTNWEHQRLILSYQPSQTSPIGLIYFRTASPLPPDVPSLQELSRAEFLEVEGVQNFFRQKQPTVPKKGSPTPEMVAEVQVKEQEGPQKSFGCSCKKSFCLKMYCACFQSGKQCGSECRCVGCKNIENAGQERKKAVRNVIEKEPTAFNQNFKYKGCRCTRSQCIKGYCDCFMEGHTCGKYCQCVSCLNRPSSKPRKGSESSTIPEGA